MHTPATEVITSIAVEVFIIFSSEVAIRHFRNVRGIAWIQAVLIFSIVVISLFTLPKLPYFLCAYALFSCIRVITGFTDNGNMPNLGYTVSKPLTPPSIPGDDDIEEVYDGKWAGTQVNNHLAYRLPWGSRVEAAVQQPSSVNKAPPPERAPSRKVAAQSIASKPADATPAKKQSAQVWSRPVPSSSALSPTPTGLVNVGNTCFANAVLQCLAWLPAFTNPSAREAQGRDASFLCTFRRTLEQCRRTSTQKQNPVNPTPLLEVLSGVASHLVKSPKGSSLQGQQDAAEFLLWLLDYIHTIQVPQETESDAHKEHKKEELRRTLEAKREEFSKAKSSDLPSYQNCLKVMSEIDWELYLQKNSTFIYDCFLGQMVEARECQNCQKMSVNFEYFTVFPLPVAVCDSTSPLDDCLSLFAKEENMGKANMLRCSCVSQNSLNFVSVKRVALFSHLPRTLILVLKRFSYDVDKQTSTKNSSPISIPFSLDLQPYTLCERLNAADKSSSLTYELQAICMHTGAQSTTYGHYVAYSRVPTSAIATQKQPDTHLMSENSSQWYYFNDTSVTAVKDMSVEVQTKRVLQNAYLLFYVAS